MAIVKIIVISIIPFILCSCATKTHFYIYDKDTSILEEIGQIKQEAKGAASIEKDNVKMVVDTRQPTFWERFITPIFKGASEKAQTTVEAE